MTTAPKDRPPKLTRKEASVAILADVGDELVMLSYLVKALAAKVRVATQEINTAEPEKE